MKTTRRQFIKSLIATAAAAAIAPQVLVESVHGASDLSAHERDVVADAMGLRQEQWQGADLWHPKTMRRTTWPDGARMTDRIDDWDIEHGNLIMFPDAKTELLVDGEWRVADPLARLAEEIAQQNIHAGTGLHLDDAVHYGTDWITPTPRRVQVPVLVPGDSLFSSVELDVSEQEPLTEERVQSAFVRLCAERAAERDQQILLGRCGGQMPVGVLGADEIDEIWKHSDEERPALISRTECAKAYQAARAGWGDNMYDSEPGVFLQYGVSPLEPAFRDYRNAQAVEQWAKERS